MNYLFQVSPGLLSGATIILWLGVMVGAFFFVRWVVGKFGVKKMWQRIVLGFLVWIGIIYVIGIIIGILTGFR